MARRTSPLLALLRRVYRYIFPMTDKDYVFSAVEVDNAGKITNQIAGIPFDHNGPNLSLSYGIQNPETFKRVYIIISKR